MHEDNTRAAPGHARRATSGEDIATQSTDPKYVRESFTMRTMRPWQIAALAVAAVAVVVVGLVVVYM